MSEDISVAEIQIQYQAEWVLLEDPETMEFLELKSGRILWHSTDRDEVYRKVRELRPKHSAIIYTGKMPAETVIVL